MINVSILVKYLTIKNVENIVFNFVKYHIGLVCIKDSYGKYLTKICKFYDVCKIVCVVHSHP